MVMVNWEVKIQTNTMTIEQFNGNLKCQTPFDWRTWYADKKIILKAKSHEPMVNWKVKWNNYEPSKW
jgi:hypothetical protein